MQWIAQKGNNADTDVAERRLWDAADQFRAAGIRPPEFAEVGPSAVVIFRVNVAGTRREEPKGARLSAEKSSEKILSLLIKRETASAKDIAAILGLTSRAVKKQMAMLKAAGRLRRVGPDKRGHLDVTS